MNRSIVLIPVILAGCAATSSPPRTLKQAVSCWDGSKWSETGDGIGADGGRYITSYKCTMVVPTNVNDGNDDRRDCGIITGFGDGTFNWPIPSILDQGGGGWAACASWITGNINDIVDGTWNQGTCVNASPGQTVTGTVIRTSTSALGWVWSETVSVSGGGSTSRSFRTALPTGGTFITDDTDAFNPIYEAWKPAPQYFGTVSATETVTANPNDPNTQAVSLWDLWAAGYAYTTSYNDPCWDQFEPGIGNKTQQTVQVNHYYP